ncbi:hypothetical protein D3H55_06805 [Bacillus salacetis]|uniref:Uncharacterized protein n=1 Tax=Bacillus salacetis TaxID=2315464 RepID=A0A3A1R781_9BACI|nr:hypothetical protein [Bacillus salacetis]RIW36159.1 hypothetical protein D3H55_06805 [Bacillus salacetis]
MKFLLKYILILAGFILSFYLYQKLLGAIPLLVLASYFFYEAFSEIYQNAMKQRHADLEKGELP